MKIIKLNRNEAFTKPVMNFLLKNASKNAMITVFEIHSSEAESNVNNSVLFQ